MKDLFAKCHQDGGYFPMLRMADRYYCLPKLDSPPGRTMTFRGRKLIQWAINNYLGLAERPELIEAATEAAARWGVGAPTGSRFMTGNIDQHEALEAGLSRFFAKPSTVLFNYGYLGVLGTVSSLVANEDHRHRSAIACLDDGRRLLVAPFPAVPTQRPREPRAIGQASHPRWPGRDPHHGRGGLWHDRRLPGGDRPLRRMLLGHSAPRQGAFSALLGSGQLELVSSEVGPGRPIFSDRFWGDLGFIHLCFDVWDIDGWQARCAAAGVPFTIDSASSFDMGDAAGRFAYFEDPDGTLIELVETHRLPVLKRLGLYVDLRGRDPARPLPTLLLKALAFNRVH